VAGQTALPYTDIPSTWLSSAGPGNWKVRATETIHLSIVWSTCYLCLEGARLGATALGAGSHCRRLTIDGIG